MKLEVLGGYYNGCVSDLYVSTFIQLQNIVSRRRCGSRSEASWRAIAEGDECRLVARRQLKLSDFKQLVDLADFHCVSRRGRTLLLLIS